MREVTDTAQLGEDPRTATVIEGMATRNVVGVFDRMDQANQAVARLLADGYPPAAISVVAKAPGDAPETGSGDTHALGGAATGGLAGALVGGALGLVALAIPGIGPIVAAGAVASVLAGAAGGGTAGAFVGSFLGLGVPTEHGERYEAAVRSGAAVVTVHRSGGAAARRTADELTQLGARETAVYQPAL
jgi:hypothetical protein